MVLVDKKLGMAVEETQAVASDLSRHSSSSPTICDLVKVLDFLDTLRDRLNITGRTWASTGGKICLIPVLLRGGHCVDRGGGVAETMLGGSS